MLRRVYMGLCTTAYLLVLFSFNVTSNAKRRLVLTMLHPIYMENKPTKLLTHYSYVWITLSHKSLYHPTSFTFRILNTEILFAILTFYQFTGIIYYLFFLRILFNKSEWHHYWILPVFLYIYNTLSSSQTDWTIYILWFIL